MHNCLIDRAANAGNMEEIKRLIEEKKCFPTKKTLRIAFWNKDIDMMLQLVFRYGVPIKKKLVHLAEWNTPEESEAKDFVIRVGEVKAGKNYVEGERACDFSRKLDSISGLAELQEAAKVSECKISKWTMKWAFEKEMMDVAEFLLDGSNRQCYKSIEKVAARRGNLPMLELALKHGARWTGRICDAAIEGNHIHILEHYHRLTDTSWPCAWGFYTCKFARQMQEEYAKEYKKLDKDWKTMTFHGKEYTREELTKK